MALFGRIAPRGASCQVLRRDCSFAHNPGVEQTAADVQSLPLHPQDETECRRCEAHCGKVVYPAACLERACPFVYAFEEFGHRYIGCMQKVYEVEIDIRLLGLAERSRFGFGAVKAVRRPLPMCRAEVATTYERRVGELGCVNPEFFELPVGEPTFRVFAQVPLDA
jgi:hypothetical protein